MASIIVACGSGVATSETVVSLIKEFLETRNVSGVDVQATDFKQVGSVLPNYDIYVWLAKPTPEIQEICDENDILDVNGVDILTGSKGDKTFLELTSALLNLRERHNS